jgi:hypothetical protein
MLQQGFQRVSTDPFVKGINAMYTTLGFDMRIDPRYFLDAYEQYSVMREATTTLSPLGVAVENACDCCAKEYCTDVFFDATYKCKHR